MTGLFGSWFKRRRDGDDDGDDAHRMSDVSEAGDRSRTSGAARRQVSAPVDYRSLQAPGMDEGTAKMLYVQRVFADDSVMSIYSGLYYADFEAMLGEFVGHPTWAKIVPALEDIIMKSLTRKKSSVMMDMRRTVPAQSVRGPDNDNDDEDDDDAQDAYVSSDTPVIDSSHILFLAMVRCHTGFDMDYMHDKFTPLGADELSRCIRLVRPMLAEMLPTPRRLARVINGMDAAGLGRLPGGTAGTKKVIFDGSHVCICSPGINFDDNWPGMYKALPVVTKVLLNRDNIILAMSDTVAWVGSDGGAKNGPPNLSLPSSNPPFLPDLGAAACRDLIDRAVLVKRHERMELINALCFLGSEGNEDDVGIKFIDRLAGPSDVRASSKKRGKGRDANSRQYTIDEIGNYAESAKNLVVLYEGTADELNYDLDIAFGIFNLGIMHQTCTYQDWQSILAGS